MTLHLSNGDATRLAETGLPGQVVFWRDVLHEGPVPGGLPLADLSARRAAFIHSRGWAADEAAVAADFRARDEALAAYRDHEEVVLWFEHDLYDQLQIIQILEWFSRQPPGSTRISLICIGHHPAVERFCGLGQLAPNQLANLFPNRLPLTSAQLALARRAWSAFTAAAPDSLVALIGEDTSALPFLAPAIRRLLEQYPAIEDGLSRTERAILEAVQHGADTPGRVFGVSQQAEEAPFMGDWCFATEYVMPLIGDAGALSGTAGNKPVPWTREAVPKRGFWAQALAVSRTGTDILEGRLDRAGMPGFDRWLGGCHLESGRAVWRWDRGTGTIVAS